MPEVMDQPCAADCTCALCTATFERVRFFPRQLLTAEDMRAEQEYFRQRLRRHNRLVHGWGIACGATVEAAPDEGHPWQVRVCPGFVLTPQGDEAAIDHCVLFDLQRGATPEPCAVPWPCPPVGTIDAPQQPRAVYLAVRYAECQSRPVRVPAAGCGCETDCEYSRIQESFELKLLLSLPKSHVDARKLDASWCTTVGTSAGAIRKRHWPTPPCPPCEDEPWVVLATIHVPDKGKPVAAGDISDVDRRVLLPTWAIQTAVACL